MDRRDPALYPKIGLEVVSTDEKIGIDFIESLNGKFRAECLNAY